METKHEGMYKGDVIGTAVKTPTEIEQELSDLHYNVENLSKEHRTIREQLHYVIQDSESINEYDDVHRDIPSSLLGREIRGITEKIKDEINFIKALRNDLKV